VPRIPQQGVFVELWRGCGASLPRVSKSPPPSPPSSPGRSREVYQAPPSQSLAASPQDASLRLEPMLEPEPEPEPAPVAIDPWHRVASTLSSLGGAPSRRATAAPPQPSPVVNLSRGQHAYKVLAGMQEPVQKVHRRRVS
jgi:hypothetical protein